MSAKLFREFTIDRAAMPADESRTIELAFASETPVVRFDFRSGKEYDEILDCGDGCNLTRLNNAHPLLLNHDTEKQIGVIESAERGADKILRAKVRFGNSALASEIWQDVKDGIRRLVSVGYSQEKELSRQAVNGRDAVRFAWLPYEVSIVPIPADASVGVGRSDETPAKTDKQIETPASETSATRKEKTMTTETTAPAVEVVRDNKNEAKEMFAIAKRFGKMDAYEKAISEGKNLDQFRAEICNSFDMKAVSSAGEIGLTNKEARQFSFARAALALANPTDRNAQEAAAFELEVSQAAAEKRGGNSRGIIVPSEVLTRDQTVGTNGDGGYLVATNLVAGSFIDVLRKRLVVAQAGAQTLGGLVGNVAIPRQTAGVTSYWVAESGSPTEGSATFDQVTMTPHTVGAFVDLSRRTLLQTTPAIEGIIRNSLLKDIALEIDRAALHGSGSSNQPTGVAATSGIGSVAGGTNGAAPTWANIVALESAIANSNADGGTTCYITNSRVRGKLKQTLKNASGTDASFIWQDGGFDNGLPYGMVNGYKALVSNQVSNTLTKGSTSGSCSAIFFGDFSNLILGNWGTLALDVDRASLSTQGAIRLVALQDVDVCVKQATAFAAMLDAITT